MRRDSNDRRRGGNSEDGSNSTPGSAKSSTFWF
jgi:hypothetical protein